MARTAGTARPGRPAGAALAALAPALLASALLTALVPRPLFDEPGSTVVLDRSGNLLGATVAADGQWRFPAGGAVPEKYAAALLAYEDKRFPVHAGVDFLAVLRALGGNLRAGGIESGASTLSMQVMRMAYRFPDRGLAAKAAEAAGALALELACRKPDILRLYAAHAPFGGNVVGLEAAAWRWFGRPPERLGWAEAATLAVLPNSPGLIHPGRSRDALKAKRDALLDRLRDDGVLGERDWQLARDEALPEAPRDLPRDAAFYVERVRLEAAARAPDVGRGGTRLVSSLDRGLQRQVNAVLADQRSRLAGNGIRHAAVLVLDLETGAVLAYAGNMPLDGARPPEPDGGDLNDLVFARRSTGSLLKPFLYAAQLEAGELLPRQLVADVPTRFGGFAPENNTRSYGGAVPADEAVARSLNIPAVRNLRSYGLHRFYDLLKNLGMTSLFRPADQYGLTLIIGGAEGSLWELTHLYADFGRRVRDRGTAPGRYGDWPVLSPAAGADASALPAWAAAPSSGAAAGPYPFSPGAVYLALQAMARVERPEEEGAWDNFLSSHRVAWKTGTSYGFRDAWAIGITDRVVVGVWAGNASGEARPELRGYQVAAPLLFGVLGSLPAGGWFESPPDLVGVDVCRDSGHLAGPDCVKKIRAAVPPRGRSSSVCPYCRTIRLDPSGRYQVDARTTPVASMRVERRFVLPPHQEWYYRRAHAEYRPLPPWLDPASAPGARPDNAAPLPAAASGELPFGLLVPDAGARIFVPVDIDGQPGMTVFQAAHRDPRARLFWHLDGDYLGSTREIHQMEARPGPGDHLLALVDEAGRRLERRFTVLSR